MKTKLLAAVAMVAAPLLAVGFASPAMATIELQLTSGAATTGVLVGAGGVVSFTGAVGQWNINTTSGVSLSPTASLDLSSIDATATAGALPLTILLTDNNYTTPVSGFTLATSGHIVGTGAGTATFDAWTDANTLFSQAIHLDGTLGPFTDGFNTSATASQTPSTTPYELTERAVLATSATSGVEWSTDFSVTGIGVPEPASLTLLGSALVGLGWLGRRRRKAA